jgi:hypothetical protein
VSFQGISCYCQGSIGKSEGKSARLSLNFACFDNAPTHIYSHLARWDAVFTSLHLHIVRSISQIRLEANIAISNRLIAYPRTHVILFSWEALEKGRRRDGEQDPTGMQDPSGRTDRPEIVAGRLCLAYVT